MKRSGYEYDSSGGKGAEGGKGEGKGAPRRKDGTTKIEMPCVMKCLVPEVLAAAIIGKEGRVIAQMRTSCSAKLALTEYNEFYPNTDSRVLTAQANDKDALNEVAKQIIGKVSEVAKTAEGAAAEGNLNFKILVPRAAVGGIIGRGGNTIKQLRETSNAKISISEAVGSGPSAEQVVSVGGTIQALEFVVCEANNQTQMLNSESWFATWAATTGVVYGGYAGYGGSGASSYGASSYGSSMRGGNYYSPPGVDTMMQVAHSLPQYVMEDNRGFALSCVVPNALVGGLIGRGGQGTKEVQARTGCEIRIRPCENDEQSRTLQINGPLANTCAAYMLMMKRYLDAEAATQSMGPQA